jgi:hypothetical protein
MADSTTPPSSTPAGSGDDKPHRRRGPIDQEALTALQRDKNIIDATLDEMNNDAQLTTDLATHYYDRDNSVAITPANLTTLSKQAGGVIELAGAAVDSTADLRDITDTSEADQKKAIAAIRSVQASAKEQYEETHPAKLEAFFIGERVKSRQQITTVGTALYGLLRTTDDEGKPVTPKETLPGYNQAKIDQYKADLGTYYQAKTAQSSAQKDATEGRETFKDQADQIGRRRRKVQLAIDSERPHSPANTALRKRLGLPADRAMS